MDYQLAKAIVASFQDGPAEVHRDRISGFSSRMWRKTYRWLDASGLTLYFLARLKALQITKTIPAEVLQRFEKNASDNAHRTAAMLVEFIRINDAFQSAGISYVNVKGFTLSPDACPNLALRRQFDLDFVVSYKNEELCDTILRRQGYRLSGAYKDTREYKAGPSEVPSIRDLYKASSQHSVEVHFVEAAELSGVVSRNWEGRQFPVPSTSDKFEEISRHLFKHLQSEWVRVSWILEYASYVNYHCTDHLLWANIRDRLLHEPEMKLAVGAAALLAKQTFPIPNVPSVLTSAIEELPRPVRLWIEKFGDKVVLTEFPGSKLYILLQDSLNRDLSSRQHRGRLFPIHLPQQIARSGENDVGLQRIKRLLDELSYGFFRFRFHIFGGLHFLIETTRWKKLIADQ